MIECDRIGHDSDGWVWQVMFLCKLTEGLREAEQCNTEWEKRGSNDWFHSKSDEAQEGSFITSHTARLKIQILCASRGWRQAVRAYIVVHKSRTVATL